MKNCLVLILVLTLQGGYAVIDLSPLVNCNKTESILGLQQKCFDLYNIDVTLPGFETLTNLSTHPVDTIRNIMNLQDPDMVKNLCNNIGNYVDAYECTEKVSMKCVPDNVPIMSAVYPPRQVVRKRQEFVCANYHKYNISCAEDLLPEVVECANVTDLISIDPFNLNVSELLQNTFCISYELGSFCSKKILKQCGELTVQIYESTQPDTSSCHTSTDGPATVDPTVVDCDDPQSVRRGYLNCLSDQQILFLVPNQSSEETSDFILNAMTLQENRKMCSNLADYKDAINCTLSLQRQCTKAVLKPTVPDVATVQSGFDRLCKHIDDFNSGCVAKVTSSNACALRRRRSLGDLIILRHLCEDDALSQQCLLSEVTSCGQKTTSLYKVLLKSQSPAKCVNHKGSSLSVPLIG